MSFKQGQFYAIQGKDSDGRTVFVEGPEINHAEKLKKLARKAAIRNNPLYNYDDDDYYGDSRSIKISENPFALKTWPVNSKVKDIIDAMRSIRSNCGANVDPTSLKIVIVATVIEAYTPESPSDEETELRRFVLEKLSIEEQKLLKVEHWAVYNKLADRSMLEDDNED